MNTAEKLTVIRNLLQADADNPTGSQFNLASWVMPAGVDARLEPEKIYAYEKDAVIPINCGTQACAIGLVVLSRVFEDQGFSYEIENRSYDGYGAVMPIFTDKDGYKWQNYNAVEMFLGITEDEARYLFNPFEYEQEMGRDAELEVIQRLDETIKKYAKVTEPA